MGLIAQRRAMLHVSIFKCRYDRMFVGRQPQRQYFEAPFSPMRALTLEFRMHRR